MAPSSPSPHPAEKPSLSSEGSTDSRHFRTLTHAASLATDDSDSQFASETDCSDSEHGSELACPISHTRAPSLA